MTSEQEGTIVTVQNDIRSALKFLAVPWMTGLNGLRELREQLTAARDLADSMVLESGTPFAKKDTIQDMTRDIAIEDSK